MSFSAELVLERSGIAVAPPERIRSATIPILTTKPSQTTQRVRRSSVQGKRLYGKLTMALTFRIKETSFNEEMSSESVDEQSTSSEREDEIVSDQGSMRTESVIEEDDEEGGEGMKIDDGVIERKFSTVWF